MPCIKFADNIHLMYRFDNVNKLGLLNFALSEVNVMHKMRFA